MTWVAMIILLPFTAYAGYDQNGIQSATTAQQVIEGSRESKSLIDFVATLPRGLFRNSMLNIASRSTQRGTLNKPRVILFEGHLTVAYAGFAGGTQYAELMEFQLGTGRYDFYRLNFTAKGATVEKNPEFCKKCHTQALRPIWPTTMMMPWFNGFAGVGDSSFTEMENERLKTFVALNQNNPLYAPVIEHLNLQAENRSLHLLGNNLAYEAILDDEMAVFTATNLVHHPQFKQMAAPILAVLSRRNAHYARGYVWGTFDFARELAPFLNEDSSILREELESRSEQAHRRLAELQRSKLIMHSNVLQSPQEISQVDDLREEARLLSSLQLVLDRHGAGNLMEEIFSLGLHGEGPELLGVNLNPWFYAGKLERELLRISSERSGVDMSNYRYVVTEDFDPNPISFSVWQNREGAREALDLIHRALNCEDLLRSAPETP